MDHRARLHRTASLFIPILVLLLATSSLWGVNSVSAQQPTSYILVCVTPEASPEYALIFRETTSFGLLIPEKAGVTVSAMDDVSVALFEVVPDAPSGGYLVVNERLGQSIAQISTPIKPRCATAQADLIDKKKNPNPTLAAPVTTIPLPVSHNHILVIQRGKTETLPKTIFGVTAVQFRIPAGTEPARNLNFQILQMNTLDPDLQIRLPNLATGTPFGLIANKPFTISRSLPGLPTPDRQAEFDSPVPGTIFSVYIRRENPAEDFYKMLNDAFIRIYPAFSVRNVADGYEGGFLSIQMTAEPSKRFPAFEKGKTIRPIQEANVSYFLPSSPNQIKGRLYKDQTAKIEEVEATTGRLFITRPDSPKVYIEAWLVEVVE